MVQSYPEVSNEKVLLLNAEGCKLGGYQEITTIGMKTSPLKTLHELFSHQLIYDGKLLDKDVQTHQVEELEEE